MKGNVRLKVTSTNLENLNKFLNELKEIVDKLGGEMKGPIPLPTKRLTFSMRRSPDGQGTETFERWELRIHKRMVILKQDERVLRAIAKLAIPQDVKIEMRFEN